MGYSHGVKYSEKDITRLILEVSKIYGRMASESEMIKYFGNTSLANKISRTGGFYYWADKLDLITKNSETKLGYLYERKAEKILKSLGYEIEFCSTKAPYDIVVNGTVRIDVKVAKKYFIDSYHVNSFGINKKYPTADLYMCFALDEFGEIQRTLIIPAIKLKNSSTLSIGKKSKYDQYKDNYKLIDKFISIYEEI